MYNSTMTDLYEYRVVARQIDDDTVQYGIHSIHYDQAGNPVGCSPDPIVPITHNDYEDLTKLMVHLSAALTKPIMQYDYFYPDSSKGIKDAMELLKK